jgi:hypothetical protein
MKNLGRGVDLPFFSVNIAFASLPTQCKTTAGVSSRKASLHRPMVSVGGKRGHAASLWVIKPVVVMPWVDAARASLTIRSIAFVSQDATINLSDKIEIRRVINP